MTTESIVLDEASKSVLRRAAKFMARAAKEADTMSQLHAIYGNYIESARDRAECNDLSAMGRYIRDKLLDEKPVKPIGAAPTKPTIGKRSRPPKPEPAGA